MNHERIIHILNYITRATDEKHGVTINDIREHLANSAGMYDVSELTVRRDIERLETAGYQITKTEGAHNTVYYHLTNKSFTVGELLTLFP